MESALSDVRFLANSANRVEILDELTNGAAGRRKLQERTGVSRSTAARVLDDAEERGWVDSEGSRYRITATGEVMIAEFVAFVETTRGVNHLGEAVEWLPEVAHALDFRHLRSARVTTPTARNPTAQFDRGLELVRAAEEYRGLTQNSLPEYMDAIRDRVVSGELAFEAVIEARFLDGLSEATDRAAVWDDVADGVWSYDGRVPTNMHVVDGTALIWLCDGDGAGDDVLVKGLLESDHPEVVSWARSLYERYRADAEPFTGPTTTGQ